LEQRTSSVQAKTFEVLARRFSGYAHGLLVEPSAAYVYFFGERVDVGAWVVVLLLEKYEQSTVYFVAYIARTLPRVLMLRERIQPIRLVIRL